MNKQELAKQYADKKVVKKGQYIECDFDVRKELTTFVFSKVQTQKIVEYEKITDYNGVVVPVDDGRNGSGCETW